MIDFCDLFKNVGFILSKLFETFNFLFFPACCFLILFFGFFIKFCIEKPKTTSLKSKKTGLIFDELAKKFRQRFIELVTDDVVHFLNLEGHDLVDYLAKCQRKYLRDVHCFIEPSQTRVSIINHDSVSNTTIRILEIQGIEGCFDLEENTCFIFNREFKISGIRLKMVVIEADFFAKFLSENKLYFFSMNKVLVRPEEMPLSTILNGTKHSIVVICPVGIVIPKNYLKILCEWERQVPLHILEIKNVPFDENANFELLETFFEKFGNSYFYSFILWFDVSFDGKYEKMVEKQISKILEKINKKHEDFLDLQLKIYIFPEKKESLIYIYNQICDYKGNYWSKWIKNEDYLQICD